MSNFKNALGKYLDIDKMYDDITRDFGIETHQVSAPALLTYALKQVCEKVDSLEQRINILEPNRAEDE